MKRHEERTPAELRAALDSWDPVRREGGPAAEEVAAVRRRVLAATPPAPAPRAVRWRPLAVAAAAVVLVVVLVRQGGDRSPFGPKPEPETAGRVAGRPAAAAPAVPDPASGIALAPPVGGEGPERRAESPDAERRAPGAAPLAGAVRRRTVPGPAAASRAGTAEEPAAGAPLLPAPTAPGRPALTAAAPGEGAPAAATASTAPPRREVHLVAPGGTRIVWLVAAGSAPSTDSSEENT